MRTPTFWVKVRVMSIENQKWNLIISACIDRELGFSIDFDNPEPWLSYRAIAFFTQRDCDTVEKKCGGLARHSAFAGMVKWSQIQATEEKSPKLPEPKVVTRGKKKKQAGT